MKMSWLVACFSNKGMTHEQIKPEAAVCLRFVRANPRRRVVAGLRLNAALALLTAVVLTLGACATAQPQTPQPRTDGYRTIAQGYSLLYGITSQQKDLKKLLLVKVESDDVDAVISELADYTGALSAELEDMASRYPALTVETQFLPEVEVKTRESLAAETTEMLLAAKGMEFERILLLKQLSALEQERNLAKVMAEIETADERRAFWRRTEKRFAELQAKVERLLERQYFSHSRRDGRGTPRTSSAD